MKPFTIVRDAHTGEETLDVALSGPILLNTALLNKGTAFTNEERRAFDLLGLLPPHVDTLDEQVTRVYRNYQHTTTDQERYSFLVSLLDRNETLFYRLLHDHITEMMPIIYTPMVGTASQQWSYVYRRPRGLYISYEQRDQIASMLRNVPHKDVRVIVVTDGERILGLGDLGMGGMGIPVGKLALYTLCAGVHPATTLPILLDVGTDNGELLSDPLYLGQRHPRIRGADYDAFIDLFVQAVQDVFPDALLQWEDFANQNAKPLLDRYRDQLCSFNDDIQGTGAVTLAGLLAAAAVTGSTLRDQRIVMYGAGSAAIGIVDQIVTAMQDEGLTTDEARARIWLIDRGGLAHTGRSDLDAFKQQYAKPWNEPIAHAVDGNGVTLLDVVKHVQPTVLIGTAAQPGAFTEEIVREMAHHVERPIIFPLSNPTSKSEAVPASLIEWTGGRALVATGSPFAPVPYQGREIRIGQCNNSFIFPGMGLGVVASGARRVTDSMFIAAARALSTFSPARHDPAASLFPALENVRDVSRQVALAVATEAQRVGVADATTPEALEQQVEMMMWSPRYRQFTRAAEQALSVPVQ